MNILEKASIDASLSLRARGVLCVMVQHGHVCKADELTEICLEGRDAVRGAKRELKQAGYIISVRMHDKITKRWYTQEFFADDDPTPEKPTPGKSGVISTSSYSDISISIPKGIEILRTRDRVKGTKEESVRQEDLDEGDITNPFKEPTVKSRRAPAGSVVVNAGPKRYSKPFDKWGANDLATEFSWRVRQIDPALIGHIGSDSLRGALGKNIKDGSLTPSEIYYVMEMFFEDPRNLSNLSVGIPLYKRFLASIRTYLEPARIRAGLASAPLDDLVSRADDFNSSQIARKRF